MSVKFDEIREKKFQELIGRYPSLQALTLPALWLWQEQNGWIDPEGIKYLAKRLNQTPATLYSVASFYTMFHLKPIGKYHIQVCKTLSCMLGGSETILDFLEKELEIQPNQTTKDGLFTLSQVECLGACDKAPCICINETYYEKVSKEQLAKLIKELKRD
jgi:NADH-quinone oxidoreductase subunit E